jgi:protein TIF31
LLEELKQPDIYYVDDSNAKRPLTWLAQGADTEIQKHSYNQSRANMHANDMYGYNPKIYRDWNEELYNCKLMPKGTTMEKVNRVKVLKRLHLDFLEAAYLGAQAIIENKLIPFNVACPISEQCYIFNNIFYTWAYDDYKQEKLTKGSNGPTTYSYSNTDLRNLNLLNQADLDELSLINTVLIDYRGFRLICQSMIPGILGCDQKIWAKHGTIDDG